ncbi:MAG: YtxH domain-containing protein [Candidatus Saccharimonadales bacterium]
MVKRFPIGAIIGAVAGVVAGVLVAPKSGKETREDLKVRADELKIKAIKTADETKSSAEDLKKNLKNKLQK